MNAVMPIVHDTLLDSCVLDDLYEMKNVTHIRERNRLVDMMCTYLKKINGCPVDPQFIRREIMECITMYCGNRNGMLIERQRRRFGELEESRRLLDMHKAKLLSLTQVVQ